MSSYALAVQPLIGWRITKRRIGAQVAEIISRIDHATYVEPFVGRGGVLFQRPAGVAREVVNDLSIEVVNLLRILQRHHAPLVDTLGWLSTYRERLEWLEEAAPETLTNLIRAARFLYLQRAAFGDSVVKRGPYNEASRATRFDIAKLIRMLEIVNKRLKEVAIERLPYPYLIEAYDHPQTLFYLDPPYWENELDDLNTHQFPEGLI